MWLVNVSVMLAVVQWASSAGGSPRLPTRITPPLVCAWAAVVRAASPNRTAMLAVKRRRSKPDRAIPPPPSGEYVRTGAVTLPRPGSLVNVPVRAERRSPEARRPKGRREGWSENSAAPGGLSTSPARRMDPGMWLRNGDRGAVAVGGDREGAGAARRVGVGTRPSRRATRRRRGNAGDEGTGALAETVRGRLGQVGQGRGQRAHVGREHADGRAEGPGVGLGLGDAGAGLDVGVQRDRDGREDTDDGHHDHQLDEREAALRTQGLPSRTPEGRQDVSSRLVPRASAARALVMS